MTVAELRAFVTAETKPFHQAMAEVRQEAERTAAAVSTATERGSAGLTAQAAQVKALTAEYAQLQAMMSRASGGPFGGTGRAAGTAARAEAEGLNAVRNATNGATAAVAQHETAVRRMASVQSAVVNDAEQAARRMAMAEAAVNRATGAGSFAGGRPGVSAAAVGARGAAESQTAFNKALRETGTVTPAVLRQQTAFQAALAKTRAEVDTLSRGPLTRMREAMTGADKMRALQLQYPGLPQGELGKMVEAQKDAERIQARQRFVGSVGSGAMNVAAGTSLLAIGAGILSAGFEKKLMDVKNNTTMTNAEMGKMRQTILALGKESGASFDQLADGFMHAMNMGHGAANSTIILREAMKSAVATGSNVADTVDILAKALKEFNIPAERAGKVMNTMHLAAALGNMTLQQFDQAAGPAYALASNLGVGIQDVSAAFSALTRHGFDASQAATQLRGMLSLIVRPSKQAQDFLAALGKVTGVDLVSDFSKAGLASKGLYGVIEDVNRATGGHADIIIKKLIPAQRGGIGAMVLAQTGAKDYRDILNTLNQAMAGKLDPTTVQYGERLKTTSQQFDILVNKIKAGFLPAGDQIAKMLPDLTNVILKFVGALTWVLDLFTKLPHWIQQVVIALGTARLLGAVTGLNLGLGGLHLHLRSIWTALGNLITRAPAAATALGTVNAAATGGGIGGLLTSVGVGVGTVVAGGAAVGGLLYGTARQRIAASEAQARGLGQADISPLLGRIDRLQAQLRAKGGDPALARKIADLWDLADKMLGRGPARGVAGLQPEFAGHLQEMIAASGGRLSITSGARSVQRQNELWQDALKKYGSPEAARKWVAPPGRSRHNMGLAADLGGDLSWAHAHAAQFGLRFPLGNEAWHVEPVGARSAGGTTAGLLDRVQAEVDAAKEAKKKPAAFTRAKFDRWMALGGGEAGDWAGQEWREAMAEWEAGQKKLAGQWEKLRTASAEAAVELARVRLEVRGGGHDFDAQALALKMYGQTLDDLDPTLAKAVKSLAAAQAKPEQIRGLHLLSQAMATLSTSSKLLNQTMSPENMAVARSSAAMGGWVAQFTSGLDALDSVLKPIIDDWEAGEKALADFNAQMEESIRASDMAIAGLAETPEARFAEMLSHSRGMASRFAADPAARAKAFETFRLDMDRKQQAEDIGRYRSEMARLQQQMMEATAGSGFARFRAQTMEVDKDGRLQQVFSNEQLKRMFALQEKLSLVKELTDGSRQIFERGFLDVLHGRTKNLFKDILGGFKEMVLQIIAQRLAERAADAIGGLFGGLFGGTGQNPMEQAKRGPGTAKAAAGGWMGALGAALGGGGTAVVPGMPAGVVPVWVVGSAPTAPGLGGLGSGLMGGAGILPFPGGGSTPFPMPGMGIPPWMGSPWLSLLPLLMGGLGRGRGTSPILSLLGGGLGMAFGGPLGGMIGGLAGGLLGGIGSVFGFAEGGRPPVGMPSLVGERGPELFVPDRPGTVVPSGRPVHVTVTMNNYGPIQHEADENRLLEKGARLLERRMRTL